MVWLRASVLALLCAWHSAMALNGNEQLARLIRAGIPAEDVQVLRDLVAADGVAVTPAASAAAAPSSPLEPRLLHSIAAFHESMEFWYRLTKRLAE